MYLLMRKYLFIALLGLLATACASKKEEAFVSVEGDWKICQVYDEALVATEEFSLPELSMKDGSYHMYCGCNQINGSYQQEEDIILLENGLSTKMFCPDVMDLEDQLLALLGQTYTVSEEDGSLVLRDDAGATILVLTH